MNPDYPVSVLDGKGDKLNDDSDVQAEAITTTNSSEESQSEDGDKEPRSNIKINENAVQPLSDEDSERKFTDEHYVIASPVVLGFSLSEKIWIEIVVSGIREITWDADAFASLMLPSDQKNHLKALVESHSRDSGQRSDDIIKG